MLWVIIGIVVILLLTSGKKVTPAENVTNTGDIIPDSVKNKADDIADKVKNSLTLTSKKTVRQPPPGYAGPEGGPYYWAGIGEPPSGLYNHPGIEVTI